MTLSKNHVLGFKNWTKVYLNRDSQIQDSNTISIILLVSVYDIVITGNNYKIQEFVIHVNHKFSLKNLEKVSYFFDIEVLQSIDHIYLCQKKYIQELLQRIALVGCKFASIVVSSNGTLSKFDRVTLQGSTSYRSVTDAL